jgi:hypothetical protein
MLFQSAIVNAPVILLITLITTKNVSYNWLTCSKASLEFLFPYNYSVDLSC